MVRDFDFNAVHAVCRAHGRKTKKNPFGQFVSTACRTYGAASPFRLSTTLAEVTCPECLAAIRKAGWRDSGSLSNCCDRLPSEGHRLDCPFAKAFDLPRRAP